MPYDRRSYEIEGDHITSNYKSPLQLCVQAKNSDGSIGSWFDSQCQTLPMDFEAIKIKYNRNSNGVLTIKSSKMLRAGSGVSESIRSMSAKINRVAHFLLFPVVFVIIVM